MFVVIAVALMGGVFGVSVDLFIVMMKLALVMWMAKLTMVVVGMMVPVCIPGQTALMTTPLIRVLAIMDIDVEVVGGMMAMDMAKAVRKLKR